MDLESLKAAMDDAAKKLEADPKNADLVKAAEDAKKAYDEAKAEADKGNKKDDPDDPEFLKDPEKTKAYIKKLRDESASHRTKNKDLASRLKVTEEQKRAILKAAGIESEDDKPEEKVKTLQAESQTLAFRNAILESAVQFGVASDDLEFYEFLVAKATSELAEGDELSEERLDAIVAKVKTKANSSANSSVGGGGKVQPNPDASGKVTLDQFIRMTITEKSALYLKNKDLYEALHAEAKAKKKLV